MKWPALAALAACAGSPPAPIHNAARSVGVPATGLPAAYAALFVDGARWQLGDVTCEIAARAVRGGWLSSLHCTGNELARRLDRDFAATSAGLWIVGGDFAGNVAGLATDKMVMAAVPTDIMRSTIEDPTYPTGRLFELHPDRGAWCMGELGYGGDESAWQLCISAEGVVGGWSQIPGGPEASFGTVRRSDPTP